MGQELGDEKEWKMEDKLNAYRILQQRECRLLLKPRRKIQKYFCR